MTPEKKVKNEVVKILKSMGVYYFYPVASGYGASGVPDIVACICGRFVGIECKAGEGKPTALQEKNLTQVVDNGGISVLVNEKGIKELEVFLWGVSKTKMSGMFIDLLKGEKK
jgi:Holliday junction resolvase